MGNASGGHVPKNGVTALCAYSGSPKLLTGGADGKVRVWALSKGQRTMLASMQEHRGAISGLSIKNNDTEAISASADGSCIVWALEGAMAVAYVRIGALYAATCFKSAIYFPDESQLLTCGTDRKITYWDACDLERAIRVVDGSDEAAEVNTLDMSPDGHFFVSGGADRKVMLWNYDEGSRYYEGEVHSGSVTRARIAPDQRTIVSVGTEGGVCIWSVPENKGPLNPLEAGPAA